MAYDEGLAQRIRELMEACPVAVQEKRMFGGLAFMVNGNICCGLVNAELMARMGPVAYEQTLALPHAREMDFTSKPLRGFVYVAEEGIESDQDLAPCLERAYGFVSALSDK